MVTGADDRAATEQGEAIRSPVRVLAIEDNPGDALLVRSMLEAVPGKAEVVCEPRLEAGVERLRAGGVDCVLLDLTLPDGEGLTALAEVRGVAVDVPVIVLSGRQDEDLAVRAVQEGAQDYLVKGQVGERQLIRAIDYAIERKRAAVELARQALHDGLTRLPNRAVLDDRLAQALARLDRGARSLAVLFLDLDGFKEVNDSLGHEMGDRLLVQVAGRLVAVLRAGDTAARFGGDEFVVLCEDADDSTQAVGVARRVLEALGRPFDLDGQDVTIGASIGIAVTTSPQAAGAALLRDADAAMYRAKGRGGGGIEVHDAGAPPRSLPSVRPDQALTRALERSELRLETRPEVDLATGALAGAEAVARWAHPVRGLVSTDDALDAASEPGLAVRLGAWALEAGLRELERWTAVPGGEQLVLSVDLGARQCGHVGLARGIEALLATSGVDPARVRLEVAEATVMADLNGVVGLLHDLEGLGVGLAVDHFGADWASLRVLQRLPVHVVKLDPFLVRDVARSSSDAAMAGAIIGLARALGLRTVAEGVDGAEQAEVLGELGCDAAQGRHLEVALPGEALDASRSPR